VSTADLIHSFEGLVGCLITLNDRAQFAGHISDFDRVGIAFWHNHAIQDVALGEYAQQLAAIIKYANCANIPLGHKLRRFLHSGCILCRIGLAVANDVPYEHRFRLLIVVVGCGYYSRVYLWQKEL
jgi:hypothetical protein